MAKEQLGNENIDPIRFHFLYSLGVITQEKETHFFFISRSKLESKVFNGFFYIHDVLIKKKFGKSI